MQNPVFKLEKVVRSKSEEEMQDFEGPLDLILYLLGKNKMEIDHPLARAHWSDKVLWMQTRTQGGQVHHCIGASASSTPGNMYLDLVTIAREL